MQIESNQNSQSPELHSYNTGAHISVPPGAPGIIGPMMAYPATAKPLNELAELLLVGESATFSKADREAVASYVSYLNDCIFCSECHGAVADFHSQNPGYSRQIWANVDRAPISERLRALLKIASKVQKSARSVKQEDVEAAKKLGASERDIHDTVLIAAAFCMFNRYVDGLGTIAPPRGHETYMGMGKMLGQGGYINAIEN